MQSLTMVTVPDSDSGTLQGISGRIEILDEEGGHRYVLNTLP